MKIDDFGYVALRAHNISILLGPWHDTKFGNNNSLSCQGYREYEQYKLSSFIIICGAGFYRVCACEFYPIHVLKLNQAKPNI